MSTKKQARKTYKREMAKELRQNTKKTKKQRTPSQEHQMFMELDSTFKD